MKFNIFFLLTNDLSKSTCMMLVRSLCKLGGDCSPDYNEE